MRLAEYFATSIHETTVLGRNEANEPPTRSMPTPSRNIRDMVGTVGTKGARSRDESSQSNTERSIRKCESGLSRAVWVMSVFPVVEPPGYFGIASVLRRSKLTNRSVKPINSERAVNTSSCSLMVRNVRRTTTTATRPIDKSTKRFRLVGDSSCGRNDRRNDRQHQQEGPWI